MAHKLSLTFLLHGANSLRWSQVRQKRSGEPEKGSGVRVHKHAQAGRELCVCERNGDTDGHTERYRVSLCAWSTVGNGGAAGETVHEGP